MIDPNERYTVIDKNWDAGKSWMDPDSDYWKQNRNIDQSDLAKLNTKRDANGRITREATKDELAKLIAP
jgi:hypothetical protein